MDILQRFLTYAKVNTQSDETSGIVPSTLSQMDFAQRLAADLKAIGMSEVSVSEYGYVTATLPSNTVKQVPTVGFIAHMDTSPDFSAKGVNPRVVHAYDGSDIVLNESLGVVLSPSEFPELLNYKGQDIIVTDGTTLLGADDKAGIAAIFDALENLIANPSREHGKIRVCFTPDEEAPTTSTSRPLAPTSPTPSTAAPSANWNTRPSTPPRPSSSSTAVTCTPATPTTRCATP